MKKRDFQATKSRRSGSRLAFFVAAWGNWPGMGLN